MILPPEFSWVDTSDAQFTAAISECVHGTENIVLNAPAGSGKSLLIKIVASMVKNCIVLSPTGLTALNLCCDGVVAKTPHSSLLFPPYEIIPPDTTITRSMLNQYKAAKAIIIDEISMVSNHMLDAILDKVARIRQGTIPRLILVGDLMQLPPVVPMSTAAISDFYAREYGCRVMFFSSKWYKQLSWKTMTMYHVYRQRDPELKKHLIEIGYNEHTNETLDYFNQRVMSKSEFLAKHPIHVHLALTNSIVNKINADYTAKFPGTAIQYKATFSDWRGPKPNDDVVSLKKGIQVMCTMNRYEPEYNYRNGTVGIVTSLSPGSVTIELPDGATTKVTKTMIPQYEPTTDSSGNVKYVAHGFFCQIDCKPMRALTIHKAQGRSFDAAYLQLVPFSSPGLLYVALSRVTSLDGLGLSRPLTMRDCVYNQESFDYLEFGDADEAVPEKDPDGLLDGEE
jgi:ATP-dependent exoDNAse (exonuclease V) alpha subunit